MQKSSRITRPSRITREKIIKAASRAFAQHGYGDASIRTIVGQADVNQAAINYHFGSKEALYRSVLQTALRALMKDDDKASNPITLSRETALRRWAGAQLHYQFDPQWEVHSYVEYNRLLGDAAASPLVTLRGSPNQMNVGAGASYSFDVRVQ